MVSTTYILSIQYYQHLLQMAKPKDTSVCQLCIENPLDESDAISWIRCDICRQWLHTICANIPTSQLGKIASYHCAECEADHGPSHMKRQLKRARVKIDYVALDQGEVFAVDKSEHPHVSTFLAFEPEADRGKKLSYIDIVSAEELTKHYVLSTELPKPVLVPNADNGESGMELPCARENITVAYITEKTGNDEPVEVMDVLSQQSESPGWNLGQWRKYFYTDAMDRDRIRNVISLEVSEVEDLGKSFLRPEMVRQMDLVDKVWCDSDGNNQKRPKVTVYCLMSVAGSYTDFHIDFSGTPVYYTVCLGTKTFLMYPPTEDNLLLFKLWCQEPQQNFMWFGDYSKRIRGKKMKPSNGFRVNLHKGDLFIIPSGWIHSVHTPKDAVIIGGNYLTLRDVPMHLKIYNIEKETRVPAKYRFPMFNKVLWLTSWYYFNHKDEFLADTGLNLGKRETAQYLVNQESNQYLVNPDVKQEYAIKTEHETIYLAQEINDDTKEPESTFDNDKRRMILESMIAHLKEHYETSKTKPVARKSIPFALIGKNIPEYLEKLGNWAKEYQTI